MQRRTRRRRPGVALTRLGAGVTISLLLGPSLPVAAAGGVAESQAFDRGAVAFVVLLAAGGAATVAMARRTRAVRPIRDRDRDRDRDET